MVAKTLTPERTSLPPARPPARLTDRHSRSGWRSFQGWLGTAAEAARDALLLRARELARGRPGAPIKCIAANTTLTLLCSQGETLGQRRRNLCAHPRGYCAERQLSLGIKTRRRDRLRCLLAAAPPAGRCPACWLLPRLLAAAPPAGRCPACWPLPRLLAAAPPAGRCPACWPLPRLLVDRCLSVCSYLSAVYYVILYMLCIVLVTPFRVGL
ncbi:uncharacterized protein LOC119585325 [Penaeus monodon]|uniref:uncharacterized protein LOC119585325 n=1 Tax=Penaeus monodon TaxID=6687 RepID=UPI0018A75EA6|nr:uncharacterized protein LOC119585325 [Penaeus monodon]